MKVYNFQSFQNQHFRKLSLIYFENKNRKPPQLIVLEALEILSTKFGKPVNLFE